MKRSHFHTVAALVCAASLASAAHAQAQQGPQGPPIRPLGAVTATAADTFGTITAMRHLPGGSVLVNDRARRQLVLLDASLRRTSVVADSTSATGTAYGSQITGLIPFRGDSTLFVDPQSLSMQVIDPAGAMGRVMSVPSSQDAFSLVGMQGTPGFDASGRLVYRANPRFQMRGGPGTAPEIPDSAAIVRVDLATRALDTVGFIRTPRVNMTVERSEDGRSMSMRSQLNPLPVVDDWAVLADGSVAFIRGRDYRVEVLAADGSRRASQKVPFEWQRLSDEDKIVFMDSVKAQRERMVAVADSARRAGGAAAPAAGGATGTSVTTVTTITSGPPGASEPRTRTPATSATSGGSMTVTFVDPSELPDYKPAFFANSARADAEGNVWVRTIPTRAVPGGPVYDVINGNGELVDRVQLPSGRTIAGFGAGGVVYLVSRTTGGTLLERAHVR